MRNPRRYKSLAPVTGDAAPLSDQIWEALEDTGSVTQYMTFTDPAKNNQWGRPERLELVEVLASRTPIPDLPADQTLTYLHSGSSAHVALKDQNASLTGINQVTRKRFGKEIYGLLLKDSKDRPWFCGGTTGEAKSLTGHEPLRRLKGDGHPLMEAAESLRRGKTFGLKDEAPLMGKMEVFTDEVTCVKHGSGLPSPESTAGRALQPILDAINDRVAAALAREDRIAEITSRHLSDANLQILLGEVEGDIISGIVPAYNDHDRRRAFEDKFQDLSLALMTELRDAGLLAACDNNGPREVSSMKAWNAFMDGRFDPVEGEKKEPLSDMMLRHRLMNAPAFSIMTHQTVRIPHEFEDQIWEDNHPGQRFYAVPEREKEGIPVDRIPELFAALRASLVETFSLEEGHSFEYGSEGLRSQADGKCYILANSFLKPALALRPESIHDIAVALSPVDPPKYIRHLEMPLPSGTLVMADWLRIDGFNEGLQALIGTDDHYEINNSSGMDARARDYFEKAGLGIVQVGNSSPSCSSGGDGIWRMGQVDEDHDAFYEKGDDGKVADRPDTLWTTCTDLWANTFADKGTILTILEASGQYASRDEADAALSHYFEEYGSGAGAYDMGVTHLHLYVPTGPGIHKANFHDVFKADELDRHEWVEDYYVISDKPLSVDPDLLEEHDWVIKDFSLEEDLELC